MTNKELEGWNYFLSALIRVWIEFRLDPPERYLKRALQNYIVYMKKSRARQK